MPFLTMIQGSSPGRTVEVVAEQTILGRHPGCQIVLENVAVSRQHAQILELHGTYFVEDLRSRNRTLLNDAPIEGRAVLHPGDRIQICDVVFRFDLHPPDASVKSGPLAEGDSISSSGLVGRGTPAARTLDAHSFGVGDSPAEGDADRGEGERGDDERGSDEASSIITRVGAGATSHMRLNINPEAKLRAVLEIGRALSQVLDMDRVLDATLEGLFKLFPHADEGFVLLKDPERRKLVVKATKSRMRREDGTVRVSMTIVRQAMRSCEAILSADAARDRRFQSSESITDLQIRSMMCVPLVGKSGEAFGVVQIDALGVGRAFAPDDLELLASVTGQVALAIENARMHQELLEQRDIQRDLDFATQVQLGFLPSTRPVVPGYVFYDHYEPAQHVGGDYFDYVPLPDGRTAVTLGDVAGKGVPAALLMARLSASARYHLLLQRSPSAALVALNRDILSGGLGHRFVTCVIVVVDPVRHRLTIASAGHLPALLRSADGSIRLLGQKESGMPLGVAGSHGYEEFSADFAPRDLLLLYTDGVTEAMNAQHEIYGRDGLVRFVSRSPAGLREVVDGVVEDVDRFCDEHSQRDDVCLVAVQRIPDAPTVDIPLAAASVP